MEAMIDWTSLLITLITSLSGCGLFALATKAGRRKASAEAELAATQARTEEFHLLREQIELNQQQNIDLIKLLGEKEERFKEQTDRLRECQRELVKANEREIILTNALNESNRQRDYWKLWHCRSNICAEGNPDPAGRQPPNDILKTARFDPRQAGIEI